MVDFQIEREEFEDINNNGYWDQGIDTLLQNYNNNGQINYYDYNNNGKYDQILIDGKLYYEDYDNPKTSGLGKFILNSNSLNYNFRMHRSTTKGLEMLVMLAIIQFGIFIITNTCSF